MFNKTFGSYIFNVADVAVTAGIILLLLAYNREAYDESEKEVSLNNCLVENKD
jgi:lipoprotein signal peptidase